MGDNWVNGINLYEIEDELELHQLMDQVDDIDDRKKVRNRLKDVMAKHKAEREEMMRRREDDKEQMLRKKIADAEEQKRRTLAMYDAMAKSAPAGGAKTLDVSILRTGVPSAQPPPPKQQLDLVEEGIRDRQRVCDEKKKITLAAFDKAARSGPAGQTRIVDFDSVTRADKKPMSPKDKFKQMDAAISPKGGANTPNFKAGGGGVGLTRSPSSIKDALLLWVKTKTGEYKNISIDNFSSSWANGLAFCALIHHFYPDAFDYDSLDAKNRRHNFDLAFRIAEEKADIAPLLDVDDMIMMKNRPDWKCVFTYVQSFYRRFRDQD